MESSNELWDRQDLLVLPVLWTVKDSFNECEKLSFN